eukprot:EG_transcript_23256
MGCTACRVAPQSPTTALTPHSMTYNVPLIQVSLYTDEGPSEPCSPSDLPRRLDADPSPPTTPGSIHSRRSSVAGAVPQSQAPIRRISRAEENVRRILRRRIQ